eukprot:TRINITY_DN14586_c0_g3_i9.p2 TRINITY_DN14586_c0_g3~~TRINITY_DN14586_c0_g3_i9.p2  ORF type:complete len:411 (+),score=77.05 TRINITY_DN14586_c0_g3_i9:78-1310(+)
MPTIGRRQLRAVRAAFSARCPWGRRCSARSGGTSEGEPLRTSRTSDGPGPRQGAAQVAPPPASGVRNFINRLLARLPQRKKPAASGSTQTAFRNEVKPTFQDQDHSFAQEWQVVSPRQSGLSQSEVDQNPVDSQTVFATRLQAEIAALQEKLQCAVREEAAARQRARCLELQMLPLREEQDRGDVETEMCRELATLTRAFPAPGTGNSEGRQAPNGHADGRKGRGDHALDLVPAETAGSRRPTYARDWLLLDVICHWVSTFVYRDWACVCSTAARAVAQVIFPVHRVWGTTAKLLGEFQSVGQASNHDSHLFGPEPGPLLAAHDAVLALHNEALQTENPDGRWKQHFLLNMRMTALLYEEMRLHQRQEFITSANRATNLLNAFRTLERTLEKRDARLAAATAVSSGSADP